MITGVEQLLEKFGTPLGIAEALIKGELSASEQHFVGNVVHPIVLEAAKFRLRRAFIGLKPRERAVIEKARAVVRAWAPVRHLGFDRTCGEALDALATLFEKQVAESETP